MDPKTQKKLALDAAMVLALLPLMTYERIGAALHEWLGLLLLALFAGHHLLNKNWHKALVKGRWPLLRVWQTALVVGAAAAMLGLLASGAMLSRYALRFLPSFGGRSFARTLHMLCAYWGFVLFGLHLGVHGRALMSAAKRAAHGAALPAWLARGLAAFVAVCGVFALVRQRIGDYLFLRSQFVFIDFERPLFLLLLDYAAIFSLFVLAGHYITLLLRHGRGHDRV